MEYPEKWHEENGFLTRTIELYDFMEVIGFVNRIALIADEMEHHPDIDIFSYNKIKIKTKTHDQDKITDKDKELAEKINEIYS